MFLKYMLLLSTAECCYCLAHVKPSIEYFVHKNVKFICMMTCKYDTLWTTYFTKSAMKHGMSVSKLDTDLMIDYDNFEKCMDTSISSTVGVLLSSKCDFEKVLLMASHSVKLDDMHKWLIFTDNSNTTLDHNVTAFARESYVLSQLNIGVDADITLLLQKDIFNEFLFYEVYNFGKILGGKFIINEIGIWNENSGVNIYYKGYKYYKRWDFQQMAMRMVVVFSPAPKHFDPKMITDYETPTDGVAMITKTSSVLLEVIAGVHNFRYNYSLANLWTGYSQLNKTRVVVNSLYFRENDISPILRLVKASKEKVDYLIPPLTSIETRYFFRIPTNGVGKFVNEFITPFTTQVWVCILVAMGLCCVVLLLSARLEERPSSAQYAVFSVAASICLQFFEDLDDIALKRISAARKTTLLVVGLLCLMIYNYYTSSVVSWLLNGPPSSINSLQDLLESPLVLIYEDIGYTRTWVQNPTYYYTRKNFKVEHDMRERKVLNQKRTEPLYQTIEKGIEMVKSGGYAYHTEPANANLLISRTFTQSELCEMGSLLSMEKTSLLVALPKKSPYKEFLNWGVKRLQGSGIISCIQKRTGTTELSCSGTSPRALSLGGAAPAFILLVFGYFVALIILALERCFRTIVMR